MQTARVAKRPLIHTDENLDVNPIAKRMPLADKAAIAADKENATARKTVVKKASVAASLVPRAAQAKVAPASRAALSDLGSLHSIPKETAPPTKSLTALTVKTTAKPTAKVALSSVVPISAPILPPTVAASIKPSSLPAAAATADLSLHDADISLEAMVIDVQPKLPPGVEDIDAQSTDPGFVAEYANDIFAYYYEKEKLVQPSPTYLAQHKDITADMRLQLVDWLIALHVALKKPGDVLHLNIYLVDAFLAALAKEKRALKTNQFQAVGVACLLIASKIEEVLSLSVNELVDACNRIFHREEILKVESLVLSFLGFNLTVPTSLQFMRRFSRAGGLDAEAHMLARYLLDTALIDYGMLKFLPSLIAASAVYLAKRMWEPNNDDVWTPTLAYYTKYEEADLLPCATALNELIKRRPTDPKSFLAVQRKYYGHHCHKVARIPPLAQL